MSVEASAVMVGVNQLDLNDVQNQTALRLVRMVECAYAHISVCANLVPKVKSVKKEQPKAHLPEQETKVQVLQPHLYVQFLNKLLCSPYQGKYSSLQNIAKVDKLHWHLNKSRTLSCHNHR